MNKFMVILGILLIAGLSFAATSWMEVVEGRYYCAYIYSDTLYGIAVNLNNSENLTEEQCNLADMYGSLYYYTEPLNMLDSLTDMYDAAGCEEAKLREDPAVMFRAAMRSYNINGANFKAMFNQCVRSYLAEGGDRDELITALGIARGAYIGCIPGSACHLPRPPFEP